MHTHRVGMHILLVADGRSPITRRWVAGLLALQHSVSLISTFPCQPLPGVRQMHVLPVAFGAYSGSQVGRTPRDRRGNVRRWVGHFRSLFMGWRYALGPLTLPFYTAALRRLIHRHPPDLVHALRIPFEGMLAAHTPLTIPLVISIWGNDLTLHAHGSAGMRRLTLRTLRRADGLLADARRDLRLALQWGFDPDKPRAVLPGGGGIDLEEIERVRSDPTLTLPLDLPVETPLVVNPRGFRPGSVRNDTFFKAIPLVLQHNPGVMFICPGMAGQTEALRWVETLRLTENVRLLPFLPQPSLWKLFMRASVSVSISSHDGTPNSLLEAIACGAFPVCGDIESLREWITPGVNGLLVEPGNAEQVAEAILLALERPPLRAAAAAANRVLVQQQAEIGVVRSQLTAFYDAWRR